MDVLQKLQNEVKRLDWSVKRSLSDGYDFRSANTRDLLEAAIKEIVHVRLHRDLAVSVYNIASRYDSPGVSESTGGTFSL